MCVCILCLQVGAIPLVATGDSVRMDGMVVDELNAITSDESGHVFGQTTSQDGMSGLRKPPEAKFTIKTGALQKYTEEKENYSPEVKRGIEWLDKAQVSVAKGKPYRALQQIKRAMKGNLDQLGLLLKAGVLSARAHSYSKASDYFYMADKIDPDNPHLLATWAGVKIPLKEYEEAAALLEAAEAIDSHNIIVMLNMTILNLINDTPKQITPLWERLHLKEIGIMVDWLTEGRDEYIRIMGYEKFSTLCDYVLGPGTVFSLPQLGQVLKDLAVQLQARNLDEVIEDLNLLIDLGVTKLWVRLRLAETLFAAGSLDETMSVMTALAEDYPETIVVQYNLGVFSLYAAKYRQALTALETAHRLNPEFTMVSFWLACAYVQMYQPGDAWPLLTEVAQRNPGQFIALMADGRRFLEPILTDPRFEELRVILDY